MELGFFSFIVIIILLFMFKSAISTVVDATNKGVKGLSKGAEEVSKATVLSARSLKSHAAKMAIDADESLENYIQELVAKGRDENHIRASLKEVEDMFKENE